MALLLDGHGSGLLGLQHGPGGDVLPGEQSRMDNLPYNAIVN
jgi:hypothetical protein